MRVAPAMGAKYKQPALQFQMCRLLFAVYFFGSRKSINSVPAR